MRQQVQLWYKICVHRFLFLTDPGRKVNHLERCAHHFHRKRGAFTDVGPPRLTFRRASTWATRRFLLCDTKGGGDDGTTSRSFVCLHSLFVIVVIIPPYHLKKQKKRSKTRYICQILVASRAEILASFLGHSILPESLLILPAKRAGSALWYIFYVYLFCLPPSGLPL